MLYRKGAACYLSLLGLCLRALGAPEHPESQWASSDFESLCSGTVLLQLDVSPPGGQELSAHSPLTTRFEADLARANASVTRESTQPHWHAAATSTGSTKARALVMLLASSIADRSAPVGLFSFLFSAFFCAFVLCLFMSSRNDADEQKSLPKETLEEPRARIHIPHLYLATSSSSQQPEPHVQPPDSHLSSLRSLTNSAAQVPAPRFSVDTRSSMYSASSLGSLPRQSMSGTQQPTPFAGHGAAPSGVDTYMMTARMSSMSARTPSPFASRPGTSYGSCTAIPLTATVVQTVEPTQQSSLDTHRSQLDTHRSQLRATGATPYQQIHHKVALKPPASQENIKGVRGLVQWFNVATPRPEGGLTWRGP